MKKFIALILSAITCVALVIPAGATFTQYADNEYLCLSTAGYRFNIDDYYNYMKRYNGMTYTTTSYWYGNRAGMVFSNTDNNAIYYGNACAKTYKCTYDNNGTMRLSCSINSSCYGLGGGWEGLTITSSGDVSFTTYTSSEDETTQIDIHYYSLKDEWTYEYTNYCWWYDNWRKTHYKVSDTEIYGNISNSLMRVMESIDSFASESMRECYWHYIPYKCYWNYIAFGRDKYCSFQ